MDHKSTGRFDLVELFLSRVLVRPSVSMSHFGDRPCPTACDSPAELSAFFGVILDLQPRPNYLVIKTIFQNLYKQMTEPLPGLLFSSVEMHALPALADVFFERTKLNG